MSFIRSCCLSKDSVNHMENANIPVCGLVGGGGGGHHESHSVFSDSNKNLFIIRNVIFFLRRNPGYASLPIRILNSLPDPWMAVIGLKSLGSYNAVYGCSHVPSLIPRLYNRVGQSSHKFGPKF